MKVLTCALVVMSMIAAGCGGEDSAVSDSNVVDDSISATGFESIKAGDSEDDVRAAIGEPTVVTDFGTGPYYWEYCTSDTYWQVDFDTAGVTTTESGDMSAVRCVE